MRITVQPHDLHTYREVFEIVEWKEGSVYKTKTTGKFIHFKDIFNLDLKKCQCSSPSTTLLTSTVPVELEILEF